MSRHIDEIVDLIDNALSDGGVSGDAMRWTTEPPEKPLATSPTWWVPAADGITLPIVATVRWSHDGGVTWSDPLPVTELSFT